MSSIMRRRSGETFSAEEFMAMLRLQHEADCLSSHRTERSLRPHPSAGHGAEPPYRASGLVLRPERVLGTSQQQTSNLKKADVRASSSERVKHGASWAAFARSA